jgi:hypothetical protein
MCEHEKKYCPHCNVLFECKVGSILLCQCTAIALTDDERMFIKDRYDDCLCASCMSKLRAMYHDTKLKDQINQLMKYVY